MDPVTKISESAVDIGLNYAIKTVVRELDYLVHFKDHINNLYTNVVELGMTSRRAKNLVDIETCDLREIEADVQSWRDRAEKVSEKAKELFFRDEHQACCNGLCPNLIRRYLLGKEASQIVLEAQEIKTKWTYGNNNVGHPVPIEGLTAISTTEYFGFKSRQSILDGIMEKLKNDGVRMIGIHGSGGVGKTMLVKKVARQAKDENLFYKIFVIDVSETPNFEKIQENIAEQLKLTLPGGQLDLRADRLRERLKREEKVLVIADNIWKRSELNLEALGIAFGKDQKGCKFLLTSREEWVLKIDMNINIIFHVNDLEEAEAINLFKKIVGNLSEIPQNQDTVEESSKEKYMVEVVKECAGLPLAIRTVANSLKGKSLIHWDAAVNYLKMSNPIGMDRRHDGVYRAIRLSFDSLTNKEQSLFLLCSLHKENHEIDMDYLLRHGVGYMQNDIYDAGLGVFQGSYTMEQARTSLKESIHYLKDCCLLLDGNDSGTIKMHDVIRDVAINIAKEKYMFIVKEPLELEGRSKSRDLIAFSLPYGYVSELPERLVCPKLKYFLLVNYKNTLRIPSRFFEEVKELSVLSLNGVCLPSSILLLPFLETLQTLCLVGCDLDKCMLDSVIGGMKDLKVLSLSQSNIELLPKEIGNLTRLQLLDLGNCSKLKVIPPGVLSKLTRLNELCIENSFNQWDVEERKEGNARVSELDLLSCLTTLNIHVPNARILPSGSCLKNLVRYKILIGKNLDWTGRFEMSTTLKINIDGSFQFEGGIKTLLKKCEALSLGKMEGVSNFPYRDCDGFPKLNYLDIENNTEIRYIISSIDREYIAFPVLVSICLKNMSNLVMICHGRLAVKSSPKLRMVYVERCDSLKFVLSSSMAECFSQLEEMVLHRCNGMDAIVNDDSKMDKIVFSELCNLQLRCVPELKGFSFDVDFKRMDFSYVLFNEKVSFPKLETLNIDKIDHMKMIWHDQLKSDSFCKLKKLYVIECQSLINIFPANMLGSLQGLEELRISNCESTVEVFAMQGINVGETHDITFQLKYLNLQNLRKLEFIWSLDPQAALKFQYLHEVKVCDCVSLKSLFPAAVAKHLAHLSLLEIYNCGVEEIVGKGAGVETPKFEFPQLTSLTLEQLPELKSFYPGKYELKWPLLKELKICNCDNLKIFGSENTSQQTPFLILKETFPHLEELILEWENPMTQTYNGIPDELLCKLRILELYGAPFEEICRDQHAGTFDHLTQLKLSKMHGLKHLWKENSERRSFKLQKLEVSECNGLKTFVPSSISLQNLKKLKVSICHGLISLVSSSTATSLVHLTKMEISECKSMTEIVANEGSEAVDEITFRQLKSLKLHSLDSLTSFHSGNCTIIFTSLEELIVTRCPQLKIFSNGIVTAPKLKGVKLAKDEPVVATF